MFTAEGLLRSKKIELLIKTSEKKQIIRGHVKNKKSVRLQLFLKYQWKTNTWEGQKIWQGYGCFLSFWGGNVTYFVLKPWLHSRATDRWQTVYTGPFVCKGFWITSVHLLLISLGKWCGFWLRLKRGNQLPITQDAGAINLCLSGTKSWNCKGNQWIWSEGCFSAIKTKWR